MTREEAELICAQAGWSAHKEFVKAVEALGLLKLTSSNDPVYALTRMSVEVEYAPYAGGSVQRFLTKEGAQQVVDILRGRGFKITKE